MTIYGPSGHAMVRTNTTPGSIHCIRIRPLNFADLWSNYPTSDPCNAKDEKGELLFKDQCAIRVGYALKKAGATFLSYPKGRKCWVHKNDDHILAAAELANWREKQPFVGCRPSETVTGEKWREKVLDRTGIICFEDYYTPGPGGGGDHIDLWNKTRLTGGLFAGWARARFNIVLPALSDLRKSKRIRFFFIE